MTLNMRFCEANLDQESEGDVDTDEHDMSDGEDEDKALDDETMCECPICRV